MKALSIRQPFAWAVMSGFKTIEYRSWPTKYRGRLLIHSSKGDRTRILRELREMTDKFGWPCPSEAELLFGYVLGTVDVVGCFLDNDDDWNWKLENPVRIETPFSFRGKVGLFDIEMTE